MSITVSFAGTSYTIPQTGETNWGDQVTNLLQATAQKALSTAGGTFTLLSDMDLGATYGIKSAYFKSRTSNIASAGQLRLANADMISWRNAGNTADLALTPSATGDGFLKYNSVDLVGTSLTQALTNKTISGSSNTLSNIAYASLVLTGSIVNADVSASAAIAYSKLNLTGSIVNSDVSGTAAIAYSKLNLTGGIVNADISASAAIARAKVAAGTASHVLINDVGGNMSSEASLAISRGGTGQATASAGFDALSPNTTKGDLTVRNATTNVRQAVGADGTVLTADSSQLTGVRWGTPAAASLARSTKTTSYTLTNSDDVVFFNGSGITATIHAASTASAKPFYLVNVGTVDVAVARTGSDTIIGEISQTLPPGACLAVVPDGTSAWWAV